MPDALRVEREVRGDDDPVRRHHAETRSTEARRLARHLGAFLLTLSVVWLVFFAIWRALPYARSGVEIVVSAKEQRLREGRLFDPAASRRVLAFGVSTVLCGFRPVLFDRLSGGRVASWNAANPGESRLAADVRAVIESGQPPTHVLLTSGWNEGEWRRTFFAPIESDAKVARLLFPFRDLPRDLALFCLRAPRRGGLVAAYRAAEQTTKGVLAERGFYFIEGQSHFPGHRLPDDFRLETDRPDEPRLRAVRPVGREFREFYALLEKHDVVAIWVPGYVRAGAAAAPGVNKNLRDSFKEYPRIRVAGPDYYLYPNRLFADPVHLNPEGAEVYTRALWDLLGPTILAE